MKKYFSVVGFFAVMGIALLTPMILTASDVKIIEDFNEFTWNKAPYNNVKEKQSIRKGIFKAELEYDDGKRDIWVIRKSVDIDVKGLGKAKEEGTLYYPYYR